MSIQDEIQQAINSGQKQFSSNELTDALKNAKDKAESGIKNFVVNPNANEINKKVKNSNNKWRVASASDVIPKSILEETQQATDSVKSSLETIESTLNAAKSFISLLEPLEAAITDPIGNLGIQLAKELETMVNNAKSTGVYILDMFDHYYVGDILYSEKKFEALEDQKSDLATFLSDSDYTYDYLKVNNSALDGTKSSREKSKLETQIDELMSKPTFMYKPTTYEEFIETVAEAFIDPNDLPHGDLSSGRVMFRNPPTNEAQFNKELARIKNSDINDSTMKAIVSSNKITEKMFRPGAPKFSAGSYSKVYVVSVIVPDLQAFMQSALQLTKLFATPIAEASILASSSSSAKEFLFNSITPQTDETKAVYNSFKDIFSSDMNSFNAKEFFRMAQTQNFTNPINEGEPPDFYGMSLWSLMPELFNKLQDVIQIIRGFSENPGTGFTELVESVIDMTSRKIDKLNRLVKAIDRLITFIEDISKISINILEISSSQGSYDIYTQLLESDSSAIPFAGTGKSVYIGGYVFAVGAVTQNSVGLDFQTYTQDRNLQFDDISETIQQQKGAFPGGAAFLEKFLKAFR